MGWVAIPLAVLGLAALSGGNNTSYEYATYQECTYAPPAYAHASPQAPYAPAPGYAPANYNPQSHSQQGTYAAANYNSQAHSQHGHYQSAPEYQGNQNMHAGTSFTAPDHYSADGGDMSAAISY